MAELSMPVESAVDALSEYLKPKMPEIVTLIQDFPSANISLKYPAMTFSHNTPDPVFTPQSPPYEFSRGLPDANGKTLIQLVKGQWDFSIQVDMWARNKPERDKLFAHFFSVFNNMENPAGLSLQVKKHFNTWARYDLDHFKHFDDGETSQQGIWRTMLTVLVNLKHIVEGPLNTMKTIDLTVKPSTINEAL